MRREGGWFVVRVFSALRGPLRITVRVQGGQWRALMGVELRILHIVYQPAFVWI